MDILDAMLITKPLGPYKMTLDDCRQVYTDNTEDFREPFQEMGECSNEKLTQIRKAYNSGDDAELGKLIRKLLDDEIELAAERLEEKP